MASRIKRQIRQDGCVWWLPHFLVWLLSGEFLLKWRANGGTIVLLRSLWTSLIVYAIALGLHSITEPGARLEFDATALRATVHDTAAWYGGILVVVYAALYARFAAQWTYLAGLYNQLMAAQIRNPPDQTNARYYALWKAGFIEDAEDVHLASKPMYAAVIAGLLKDDAVRSAYEAHTFREQGHLDRLSRQVSKVVDRQEKRTNGERVDTAVDTNGG